MRVIKRIMILIFLVVTISVILLGKNFSEAATDGVPDDGNELYSWLTNTSKVQNYFDMDPVKFLTKYYNKGTFKNTASLNSESFNMQGAQGTDRGYWMCIGLDKDTNNDYQWDITTIIDFDSEGNITITYRYGGAKTWTVTDTNAKNKLGTLAYLLTNTGKDNANYDVAFSYWSRIGYYYRDSILTANKINAKNYKFYQSYADGAYPGYAEILADLDRNPRKGLGPYKQLRIIMVSGATDQDRFIVGKTKQSSTKIKIVKKDQKTNQLVKANGGKFNIYYQKKTAANLVVKEAKLVKGEFVTETPLKPGKYIIEEVEPPTNYELPIKEADRTKTIDVKSGKTTTVTFVDPETPYVQITKVDKDDSNKKLVGAQFGMYELDSKGNITGEPIMISTKSYMENGKYTPARFTKTMIKRALEKGTVEINKQYGFKEVKAPDGYVLSEEVIKKKLEPCLITFTVKNQKTPTLEVVKVDKNTKKVLGGARFRVYDDEGLTNLLATSKPTPADTGKVTYVQSKDGSYLEIGKTYWVQEIEAPPGYEIDENNVRSVTIVEGTNLVTFENEPSNPSLEIIKKDSDTDNGIAGAFFTVYSSSGGVVGSGTTGNDGKLVITNLEMNQTYRVVETRVPSGYKNEPKEESVTLKELYTQVIIYNTPDRPTQDDGVIKLIENTNVPMEGVQFGLKNWNPDNKEYIDDKREPQTSDSKYWGYVTHYGSPYWVSRWEQVTDPITGETTLVDNGYWYTPSWEEYEYKYPEQYAADHAAWEVWKDNHDYWLKSQTQYVEFGTSNSSGYVSFSTRPGTYDVYEISNPNTYFEIYDKLVISNYRQGDDHEVYNKRKFIDIEGIVFIDEVEGKKCFTDGLYTPGEGVDGVRVTLKRNGSVVSSTVSGANGEYFFSGDRNNLRIEVDYLSSYSVEFEYNGMKYEAIVPNTGSINGSKANDITSQREALNNKYNTITNQSDVEYNVSDYESKIKYTPESMQYNQWVDSRYQLSASTSGVYDLYSVYEDQNKAKNTISNVNFGMREREQPDMALTEDLDRVEITLEGQTYTFKYGQRMDTVLNSVSENMAEKFNGGYANMSYTRAIFPSDISKGGMEVRAIYKVGLENQSTNRITRINSFQVYYADGYEITSTEINMMQNNTDNAFGIDRVDVGGQEATIHLNNANVNAQSRNFVYVTLKVKDSAITSMLSGSENKVDLTSVAEITSYTTLDGSKPVAGVDVDSRPGSVDITNIHTFEDDTDRAPGFNLVLQADRSVTGKIFIDETGMNEYELSSGHVRIGNGIYDEGESAFTNVEVKLIDEETGEVAKRYLGLDVEPQDAITTPDNEGNYFFDGILPGKYYIEYTWGDATYLAENYKSTIVNKEIYLQKQSNPYWYSDEFKNNVESGQRFSDAVDDENIRATIDANSNTMIYDSLQKVKLGESKMISRTPTLNLNYEYEHTKEDNNTSYEYEYVDSNAEYEVDTGMFRDQWTVYIKTNSYHNEIKDVDFGIVRRPKQELKLTKRVKNVKVTLANGEILIDANVVEKDGNYVIEDNTKYVTYIPNNVANSAMVKIEVNNEIIQGAKMEVTYEFMIKNISEIDYITSDYYYYGIVPSDKENSYVKLTPDSIVDYLEKAEIIVHEGWKLVTDFEEGELTGKIAPENMEAVKQIAKVLVNDGENVVPALSPEGNNQIAIIQMQVSKLLSTNEEIDIRNQAEIIQTTKNGGAIIESTHGNYRPDSQYPKENDDSRAEEVVLLPPTGDNQNYIIPIVIGIAGLLTLGFGIIIIRKFVLK